MSEVVFLFLSLSVLSGLAGLKDGAEGLGLELNNST